MNEELVTGYIRVSLARLIQVYKESCMKEEIHIAGHAFDAVKDEVLIEYFRPKGWVK